MRPGQPPAPPPPSRTARERIDEAWLLTEDPGRMQESTEAAIAALHRADESSLANHLR